MWETYFRQYKDTVLPFWLEKQKWNYKDDIIMVGYDDLASATGDNSWRDAVFSSSRFLMLPDGNVVNLCPAILKCSKAISDTIDEMNSKTSFVSE